MNKLSPAIIALALVFGGVVLFKTDVTVPSAGTANIAESVAPLPSVEMTSESGDLVITGPTNTSTVGRTFEITGQARAYQNQIYYQVRDSEGFKVATGGVTTDATSKDDLGTFAIPVEVPADIVGPLVVDVYTVSADDDSEQDFVQFYLQLE